MAKNPGEGHRIGSVGDRTQVRNPVTGDWTKRNRDPDSESAGEFMDVKTDGKPFKGVARSRTGAAATDASFPGAPRGSCPQFGG